VEQLRADLTREQDGRLGELERQHATQAVLREQEEERLKKRAQVEARKEVARVNRKNLERSAAAALQANPLITEAELSKQCRQCFSGQDSVYYRELRQFLRMQNELRAIQAQSPLLELAQSEVRKRRHEGPGPATKRRRTMAPPGHRRAMASLKAAVVKFTGPGFENISTIMATVTQDTAEAVFVTAYKFVRSVVEKVIGDMDPSLGAFGLKPEHLERIPPNEQPRVATTMQEMVVCFDKLPESLSAHSDYRDNIAWDLVVLLRIARFCNNADGDDALEETATASSSSSNAALPGYLVLPP